MYFAIPFSESFTRDFGYCIKKIDRSAP